MDPETWPDLLIALLSSLVFVGLPGLLLALVMNGWDAITTGPASFDCTACGWWDTG